MNRREKKSTIAGLIVVLEEFENHQSQISSSTTRRLIAEACLNITKKMGIRIIFEEDFKKNIQQALKDQAETGWDNLSSDKVMSDITKRAKKILSELYSNNQQLNLTT